MKFDINWNKWLSRIVFGLALIILTVLNFKFPDKYNIHSNFTLVVVTIFYVFFTYEMLRITRESKNLPYINIEFFFVNNLENDFFKNNELQIRQTERFRELKKEFQSTQELKKNILFVKAENLGTVNAVEVIFKVAYEKRNLGEVSEQKRKIEFGTMKPADIFIDIVEDYQTPSAEDYFKIKYCTVEYNDICGKFAKEKVIKDDFSSSIAKNLDDVSVGFISEFKK